MLAGNDKLGRWQLRLFEFDIYMIYTAGIRNQLADELSRPKTGGADSTDINDDLPVSVIDVIENKVGRTEILKYRVCSTCDNKE